LIVDREQIPFTVISSFPGRVSQKISRIHRAAGVQQPVRWPRRYNPVLSTCLVTRVSAAVLNRRFIGYRLLRPGTPLFTPRTRVNASGDGAAPFSRGCQLLAL
jgi:hypothetical protein